MQQRPLHGSINAVHTTHNLGDLPDNPPVSAFVRARRACPRVCHDGVVVFVNRQAVPARGIVLRLRLAKVGCASLEFGVYVPVSLHRTGGNRSGISVHPFNPEIPVANVLHLLVSEAANEHAARAAFVHYRGQAAVVHAVRVTSPAVEPPAATVPLHVGVGHDVVQVVHRHLRQKCICEHFGLKEHGRRKWRKDGYVFEAAGTCLAAHIRLDGSGHGMHDRSHLEHAMGARLRTQVEKALQVCSFVGFRALRALRALSARRQVGKVQNHPAHQHRRAPPLARAACLQSRRKVLVNTPHAANNLLRNCRRVSRSEKVAFSEARDEKRSCPIADAQRLHRLANSTQPVVATTSDMRR